MSRAPRAHRPTCPHCLVGPMSWSEFDLHVRFQCVALGRVPAPEAEATPEPIPFPIAHPVDDLGPLVARVVRVDSLTTMLSEAVR